MAFFMMLFHVALPAPSAKIPPNASTARPIQYNHSSARHISAHLSDKKKNPSHYGPPSNVGGQCRDDETELGYCVMGGGYFPWGMYPIPRTDPECEGTHAVDYYAFCSPPPKMLRLPDPRSRPTTGCDHDYDCAPDYPAHSVAIPACFRDSDSTLGFCGLTCPSRDDKDCPLGARCLHIPNHDICVYQASSDCYYVSNITGAWKSIFSSSGKQTLEYQEGIQRSHTVDDSMTWGEKTSLTASTGFTWLTHAITGEYSHEMSESYSSTFEMSKEISYTTQVGAGVIWQWQFTITDGCGKTTASGRDIAVTPNQESPPCCLPKYFANITEPTGSCVKGSPTIC